MTKTPHVNPLCLRAILREARRLAPDRQPLALHLFRAAVQAAMAPDMPGPGEELRVYIPRMDHAQRQARLQRIRQAIDAGEPTAAIARREGVDCSYIRRLRRRGTIAP